MFGKKKNAKAKTKLSVSLKDAQNIQPPAGGQTPPAHKKIAQTMPEARSSRGIVSWSAQSGATASPSTSAILRMDDHHQLREADRPAEESHSSDPDTSLYDYDDDQELISSLRRTITLPYGSQVMNPAVSNQSFNNRALSDFSITDSDTLPDEAVDTVSSPRFIIGEYSGVIEDVILPSNQSLLTSSLPNSLQTIPRSGGSPTMSRKITPHTSVRHSGGSGVIGSIRHSNGSMRDSRGSNPMDSLRVSFESTMKSKDETNSMLRRSVEDAEAKLDVTTKSLATLTRSEKPRAVTPEQKIDYYHKFESHIEKTLKDQEDVIKLLKERLDLVESANDEADAFNKRQEMESRRLVDQVTDENRKLQELIYKLNREISVCQTKHQKITDVNGHAVKSLPKNSETPAWMLNYKYLSPLIKSYEDQISIATQEITSLRRKYAKYESDIKSLIEENSKLRQSLKSGGMSEDAIDKNTWQQLQQHARLVLDENEVLLKELDLQDDRITALQQQHNLELYELEQKLQKTEAERKTASEEAIELKCQVNQLKSQVEELKASNKLRVDKVEHMRAVSELEMKIETLTETHQMDLDVIRQKNTELFNKHTDIESKINVYQLELKEYEREKKNMTNQMVVLEEELTVKNKEVKKANQVVAELLLLTDQAMVDKTALENYLKTEKRDKKKSVGVIIETEMVKEKLIEQFKRYRNKTEKQVDKLLNKLEKRDGEFDVERREYERQLKHLRQLVHEKDYLVHTAAVDKREVEDCLEFVWQATQADNYDMRNNLRKSLHQTPSNTDMNATTAPS